MRLFVCQSLQFGAQEGYNSPDFASYHIIKCILCVCVCVCGSVHRTKFSKSNCFSFPGRRYGSCTQYNLSDVTAAVGVLINTSGYRRKHYKYVIHFIVRQTGCMVVIELCVCVCVCVGLSVCLCARMLIYVLISLQVYVSRSLSLSLSLYIYIYIY